MSDSHQKRTWQHPQGWDGPGWSRRAVDRFEQLMRDATRKPRGVPALVHAWDDGRGIMCWYTARAGADERALRDRCRAVFGAREQEVL